MGGHLTTKFTLGESPLHNERSSVSLILTCLIQSEAHIKSKYKLKAWVIPNSQPSFNCFEEVELKILHDRGFEYRSFSYPRRFLPSTPDRNNRNGEISVVSVPQSAHSSPTTPFVKLPPHQSKYKSTPTEELETSTRSSTPTPCGQSAAASPEQTVRSLPGIGWAEKWKAQKSPRIQVEGQSESAQHVSSKGEEAIEDLSEIAPKLPPPYTKRNYYKVKIPQPSLRQLNRFSASLVNVGVFPTDHIRRASFPSQGMWIFPTDRNTRTALHRNNPSATSTGTVLQPVETPRYGSEEIKETTAHRKARADIVWQGLVPAKFDGPKSPPRESRTLLDEPPVFPFPPSDEKKTFPFEPDLPNTPTMPNTSSPHTSSPLQSEVITTSYQTPASRYPGCPKWNYYFRCSVSENEICSQPHICELCGSPEHRAAQHWHHLATAPLPEIQARPKLSSLSKTSQSPTLRPVKDRIPLFIPTYPSNVGLEMIPRTEATARVPLFVPSMGLSQAQKAAAQAERLKLRRRVSKTKLVVNDPDDDDVEGNHEPSSASSGTSRTSHRIKVIAPPSSSPSSRPVEVILPPPVRPFQSSSVTNKVSTSGNPNFQETSNGKSVLRVSAPPFQPAHVGAWTPSAGPTQSFDNLFQIPSRESKRIQIVAPKGKRREGKRILASKRSLTVQTPPIDSEAGTQKPGSLEDLCTTVRQGATNAIVQSAFTTTLQTNAFSTVERTDLKSENSQTDVNQLSQRSTASNRAHNTPTTEMDCNVLAILDEELEAIIGDGSEETIAATLETIIEICSSSPSASPEMVTSPSTTSADIPQLNYDHGPINHWRSGLSTRPTHNQNNLVYASSSTQPCISFGDLEENDEIFHAVALSASEMNYQNEETQRYRDMLRPRSADSSSTAPLDPNSPRLRPTNTGSHH